MQPETRRQIMYDEHDQRWAPEQRDPHGRVMSPQLVAVLKTVAGVTQTQMAPQGWQNPGPNSMWCAGCQESVQEGVAVVRRQGDRASDAQYTAHCPKCDTRLVRGKV